MKQAPQSHNSSPSKYSLDSFDRRHEERRETIIACDERRHEVRRDIDQDSVGRRHEERRNTYSEGYTYLSMVGWYCRRERSRRKGEPFK